MCSPVAYGLCPCRKTSLGSGAEGPCILELAPLSKPMSLIPRLVLIIGPFLGLASVALADSLTFASIDDPSAVLGTYAWGINTSGQISGYYSDETGIHGFLSSGGIFTSIDDPSATTGTFVYGINDAGQTVGSYGDTSGVHGFVDSNGTFTTIADPSSPSETIAYGINDAGQIVGATGNQGFIYNNGTFTDLNFPSAILTHATGINDGGQIVGFYKDVNGNYHGFLYSGGIFSAIDDPLTVSGTYGYGINDAGQIVGFYGDGTGIHGFLYSGGIFTTIDDPLLPYGTFAGGINDAGQIAGFYRTSAIINGPPGTGPDGFVATPTAPEPSTLLLTAAAFIGMAWYRTPRRRTRP